MIFSFSSFVFIFHLVAQGKHLPWEFLPWDHPRYHCLPWCRCVRGPPVLRLCLPLLFPRRGHYLIKKTGRLAPAPSHHSQLPINAQSSTINNQTHKATQSFLIVSPLILLSLLSWKIFIVPCSDYHHITHALQRCQHDNHFISAPDCPSSCYLAQFIGKKMEGQRGELAYIKITSSKGRMRIHVSWKQVLMLKEKVQNFIGWATLPRQE